MTIVQPLALLTSSSTKWTPAQEKTVARDFPFVGLDMETSDQFVARTYLQFLWLPESIMPISLFVPSLSRIQDASPHPADTPHPLHALLEPLLHSVRSVVAKYHTELPQILAQDGGDGENEESMMWYALGYEMMGEIGEGVNSEDAIMLEERARNMWLERLERREVQIQVLLYLLKLSLPGPCTPLPSVTIPVNDVVPSTKKKKKKEEERAKVVVPSPRERLESFMDKLCMWQLVNNMNDANHDSNKDERDWMQTFCEDVVERQFKSKLGDMCTLLRHKLFPHSPFSDEENENDTDAPSPGSKKVGSRSSRKLARSSTSSSIAQSKDRHASKPVRRSPSAQSHATTSDMRSLSVSLAQDASARRSNASGTVSSLKRAFSREVSMSRAFKPRAQPSQTQTQASQHAENCKVPPKTKPENKDKEDKLGVTLVAATPMKLKVRKRVPLSRCASVDLENEQEDDGLPCVEDEDEMWLPNSSPDVLMLGPRKRSASGSSSSVGLSDPIEGMDTPVKKRLRI